jgi:hypothetical protein
MVMCVVYGCAPNTIPAPQLPPLQAGHPADAIPGDLDVVFRFELQAMRDAMGPQATELLTRSGPVGQDTRDFAVSWALSRADTAWLAIRPGFSVDLTDNVLVLRGRLAGLEGELSPSWGRATDLGGGWFRYDRRSAVTRSAPARLYLHVNDLLVVVSTAEIDSTERALERDANDPRLRPPDKGTVSAAVRLPPVARLIEARSPRAAALLRQASELTATAAFGATGLTADLGIEFELEDDAQRAAEAIRLLLRAVNSAGLPHELTDGIHVETIGATVAVRVRASAELIHGLVSCAWSSRDCLGAASGSHAR